MLTRFRTEELAPKPKGPQDSAQDFNPGNPEKREFRPEAEGARDVATRWISHLSSGKVRAAV